MEINPQEVIKQLSNEIARLNVELALLKAVLSQAQEKDGGEEETGTR